MPTDMFGGLKDVELVGLLMLPPADRRGPAEPQREFFSRNRG
jgi:hypothetical protein